MKRTYLVLALLISCGTKSQIVENNRCNDSLIAENQRLKKERDSLQSIIGIDGFASTLIRVNEDIRLGDTAKFDFCAVYRKPKVLDYFYYELFETDPLENITDLDWDLDKKNFKDSIRINQSFPNRINIINYKIGTNYLVGYFIMTHHGNHRSRLYCSTSFIVK